MGDQKQYDELHGSNNWDGLLVPLDLNLRKTILAYGDLSSAAGQAFNNDLGSKYCGYSRYGKSSFFQGVMIPWAEAQYQVAHFLYATASNLSIHLHFLFPTISGQDSPFESNWMGYIAVSNDQVSKSIGCREICVSWRGTVRSYEWIDDILGAMPVSAEPLLPPQCTSSAQVMEGWLTIYKTEDPDSKFLKTSASAQLLAGVRELLKKYKDEKVRITCTGHSLGASLAVLSAFELAVNVATPDILVTAFVFSCPQVGDEAFKAMMDGVNNLKVLSVKNQLDIVPLWPSKISKVINELVVPLPSGLLEYVDTGIELVINTTKSPYLKVKTVLDQLVHILDFHNLQALLHTLAGWNGKDGDFDWNLLKRSLGTVNMIADILQADCGIPTAWWQEKNKGMVLEDGDWVLRKLDRADADLPPDLLKFG